MTVISLYMERVPGSSSILPFQEEISRGPRIESKGGVWIKAGGWTVENESIFLRKNRKKGTFRKRAHLWAAQD